MHRKSRSRAALAVPPPFSLAMGAAAQNKRPATIYLRGQYGAAAAGPKLGRKIHSFSHRFAPQREILYSTAVDTFSCRNDTVGGRDGPER